MEIAQTNGLQVAFERFEANMEKLEKYQEKVTRQIEENGRQMKVMQEETDRQMKETDRKISKLGDRFGEMKAMQEETDRQMKETDRKISKLGDRFGEMKAMREETDRQIKENGRQMKETDRQMKETDRKMKAMREETDRQMKETDRKISKLGDRFGEMIEYMVKPNLIDRFRELGFVFTKIYPEASIKDKKNNILAEIDLTLENGDKVMIVEVKSKPSTKDVKEHVKRMETVRRHADLHGDKRKFLGSVAGMVINENVREFSLKQGFYVIEPSGETFTITVPEGKYYPHEW